MRHLLALATAAAPLLAACIQPPPVVLLDQKTALEQQASGSYEALEAELAQAALSPRPEPLTAGELAARGEAVGAPLADLVRLHLEMRTQAELVDRMLLKRCAGEARDGQLVARLDTCPEGTDLAEVRRTVARANRQRRQLWEGILTRTPGAQPEAVQRAWRAHHLDTVVCGALVEADDGTFAPKACD